LSALGVIAARNEAGYIRTTLQTLIDVEGIEVVLIDHASVDGTREIAEGFLGRGLLEIVDIAWHGAYDLAEQLRAKQSVFERSAHDWVIHLDADEWPRATSEVTLARMLEAVSPEHQVVNFVEFVFVPPVGVDMWGQDYRQLATTYYAFAPSPLRLMRAWRRSSGLSNVAGAGHQLDVEQAAIFPEPQVLRHYIGLSWSHAIGKRANLSRSEAHLARGWSANRRDMREARPVTSGRLFREAAPWDTRSLDASVPSRHHFWEPGFAAANEPAVGASGTEAR
jgi:glycosyltransferase involved in cell wall biosynthesis